MLSQGEAGPPAHPGSSQPSGPRVLPPPRGLDVRGPAAPPEPAAPDPAASARSSRAWRLSLAMAASR
eukprot:5091045-Pyramimonas_sp.AAC.1